MVVCTACGFRNDDGAEFCANPNRCGAYLGYVGKKTGALSGGVTLALEPAVVAVTPGAGATCDVRVRNKSNVVDQYDIRVSGEPAGWTIVEPSMLSLFPDAEGSAKIRFRPGRSPDLGAGRKPFAITVQSRASAGISARQDGAVEVAPFQDTSLSIVPRTSRGGETATHRVTVENRGNVPLRANLDATDADELLGFRFENQTLVVAPGQSAYTQLVVQPRSTFSQGPPQPHPFKVQLGVGPAPIVAEAAMLQEAVVPPAPPPKRKFPVALLLIPALLLLALAAFFVVPPLMAGSLLASTGSSAAPRASSTGQTAAPPTAAATPAPTPIPPTVAPDVVLCTGPTTLKGTYLLDFENCVQGGTGDVWWEQIDSVNRMLVPRSGAMLVNMGPVGFDGLTLAALRSLNYGPGSINGSANSFNQLTPGTVVAIKTRNGHYAKMRIDSYGYNLGITSTTYQ